VMNIGESAFSNCIGLTNINFNAKAMNDLPHVNSCVFEKAGYNARGITVNIGANVTKIPAYLFYSPNEAIACIAAVNFAAGSVCQGIGESAFERCKVLTSITIPDSVTSIGRDAFSLCTSLTNLIIPDSVSTIGRDAFPWGWFYNQPDGVLYAYNWVLGFKGTMSNNTNIELNSGTKGIADYAFSSYGIELTSVTIPNSVTSIGDSAFDCRGLTSVIFRGTIASANFNSSAFSGDLRTKFYATDATNGTPGTYTRVSGSNTWTKQP